MKCVETDRVKLLQDITTLEEKVFLEMTAKAMALYKLIRFIAIVYVAKAIAYIAIWLNELLQANNEPYY